MILGQQDMQENTYELYISIENVLQFVMPGHMQFVMPGHKLNSKMH